MKCNGQSPLPEFLRPLFWKVDFERLSVSEHEQYVIERVLEYGDDQAIRWLYHTFGPRDIADRRSAQP